MTSGWVSSEGPFVERFEHDLAHDVGRRFGVAVCNGTAALRNLRFSSPRRFVHESLGWNFRMSNLQAALGVAQLEHLDRTLDRKRRMGARYDACLSGTPGLSLPARAANGTSSIYWVYGIVLDDDVAIDADEFGRRLAERGIGTRPFFWPMHEQPVFRKMGCSAANGTRTRSGWPAAGSTSRVGSRCPTRRSMRCVQPFGRR